MKTEFVAKYDKRKIMLDAHRFFRDGRYGDFSFCLKCAWENAKGKKGAEEDRGEELHTWYEWTLLGREVIHEQKTVAQVEIWVTHLKNRLRMLMSYFTYEQTCELGTQPEKETK